MTATPLCVMLVLAAGADAVDNLLAEAARFPDGATRYEGYEEDLTAAVNAQLALTDLARDCPDAEWAAMRDRLIAGLDSENRGVWFACCQALSRRDPDALAETLVTTLRDGSDPGREALVADALARIGRRLSPETRGVAATALAQRIEDLSRPCDRERMVAALGGMENVATVLLLRIGEDVTLRRLARSALPHALASTVDSRAMPLLLALHRGAVSDGERIASVLALGHLVRRIGDDGQPVDQAVQSIRTDFESHSSAAVAAAAALALARAGYLSADTDAARVFQLADDPAARKNALRAVLESRMSLDGEQRQVIEAYAQDEVSSPAVRKIALALLAEQEVAALARRRGGRQRTGGTAAPPA